jgi:F-type H+-transporting ATPase subunit b
MEALGIDLKLFIAQAINFIIVMLLLWKFAYTPILNMLMERKNKIEQGLKDSEEAAQAKAKAETESEKILEKAYKDANEIIKNAKAAAASEGSIIIKKSSEQADRIMKSAKEEAASTKEKVMNEAKKEISDVVVIALDKIVGNELTADQKNKLTSKAIADL